MSQLQWLDAVKEIIMEENDRMFDVVIRNSDTIRVAFIRKIFVFYKLSMISIKMMIYSFDKPAVL